MMNCNEIEDVTVFCTIAFIYEPREVKLNQLQISRLGVRGPGLRLCDTLSAHEAYGDLKSGVASVASQAIPITLPTPEPAY